MSGPHQSAATKRARPSALIADWEGIDVFRRIVGCIGIVGDGVLLNSTGTGGFNELTSPAARSKASIATATRALRLRTND